VETIAEEELCGHSNDDTTRISNRNARFYLRPAKIGSSGTVWCFRAASRAASSRPGPESNLDLQIDAPNIYRSVQNEANSQRSTVMSQKLAGKVAVVTGASKGIGASIAKHLAAAGAAVVVNYSSSKTGADKVVAEITAKGGKAIAVQANVAKQADIDRLFSEAKKTFDKIDVLVNNAGVYEFASLEQITAEHFHKIFDLNVLGLLLASQAAAKQFGSAGGSIVNISSVVATLAPPSTAVYSASKAAVDAVTKSLAKELGPRKIRVNSINPGMIETEGTHTAGITESEFRKETEAQTPLGRIGQPQDIAPAAVFLASDDSSWITGETFYISGGLR
jgi:3-oxoacyl-[acyl-carrier protein] reductase